MSASQDASVEYKRLNIKICDFFPLGAFGCFLTIFKCLYGVDTLHYFYYYKIFKTLGISIIIFLAHLLILRLGIAKPS